MIPARKDTTRALKGCTVVSGKWQERAFFFWIQAYPDFTSGLLADITFDTHPGHGLDIPQTAQLTLHSAARHRRPSR